MTSRLDREYPQGSPSALFCRHCQARRVEIRGALFCRECDGDAYTIAIGGAGR